MCFEPREKVTQGLRGSLLCQTGPPRKRVSFSASLGSSPSIAEMSSNGGHTLGLGAGGGTRRHCRRGVGHSPSLCTCPCPNLVHGVGAHSSEARESGELVLWGSWPCSRTFRPHPSGTGCVWRDRGPRSSVPSPTQSHPVGQLATSAVTLPLQAWSGNCLDLGEHLLA